MRIHLDRRMNQVMQASLQDYYEVVFTEFLLTRYRLS